MITTSQDVLYLTISVCAALFTVFLVWIMYYIAQISRQSNEMITDFRTKMEELDATVKDIKEKVTGTVDSLSAMSSQIGSIFEFVRNFTSKSARRAGKK